MKFAINDYNKPSIHNNYIDFVIVIAKLLTKLNLDRLNWSIIKFVFTIINECGSIFKGPIKGLRKEKTKNIKTAK